MARHGRLHWAQWHLAGVAGTQTLTFKIAYPLDIGVNILTVTAGRVALNNATTVFRTITYNPAATILPSTRAPVATG